jgi:predicted transcriptional regulator
MSQSEFEEEIKNAFWQEKKEALLASELEKSVTEKTGISRATFYRRLAELVEKGLVLKDVTKRRNTAYRLNYNATLLKLEVLRYINEHMHPFEIKYMKGKEEIKDETNLLKELGSQIAKTSLWALLKQIRTGEPYVDVVSYYLSYIGGAQALLKRTIIQMEAPYLEDKKRIALSDPKVALGELPEYEAAVKRYEEAFKTLYKKEAEDLDALDAKVHEGKSDFKIMASEEGS